MATEQKKLAVYVPADEAAAFEALVKAQGKTVTGAVRVFIRDTIAAETPDTPTGHMMGTEVPS